MIPPPALATPLLPPGVDGHAAGSRATALDETRELLDANNTPPPVTIRVNQRRDTRDDFLEAGLQ